MKRIEGGATIWARKTTDSVVFYDKPDKWFKIWFFVVNRVNHKDFRRWKRGQSFMTYSEIMEKTRSTKAQVDMCFRFLKKSEMLTTQKTTRGMTVTVLKYDFYQQLDNYKNDTENEIETTEKRQRNDTINKNDKNEKITANADFPIRIEKTTDSGESMPIKEKKVGNEKYDTVCKWAEDRRGFKFVNRIKQYSALKKAKAENISITRLKERWIEMEGEEWRKGFDWTTVVSSFDKKA